MIAKTLLTGISISFLMISCNNNNDAKSNEGISTATTDIPARLNFTVVNVYPHDTASFTQGLLIHNGKLFESTGGKPTISNYKSWMGIVDLKTGKAEKKVMLDTTYFGEGITILNNKIYQLTWETNKGFVYDANTLKFEKEFPLKTEGWGIINDGKSLIVSDGTSNLYYLNPENFSTEKVISVTDNNGPVGNLNEMEYIGGFIYANKWQSDEILKINPENGKIVGVADMSGLLNQYAKEYMSDEKYSNGEGVLNGIAYDSATSKIYITGKLWPKIFEIKFN